MNGQDILNKAVNYLGNVAQDVWNKPIVPIVPQLTVKNLLTRPPGTFTSLDPGSLYGSWKQDPQNAPLNAVMALSAGPRLVSKGLDINQIDDAIDTFRNVATTPEDKIQALNDITNFAKQHLTRGELKVANKSPNNLIESIIGKFTDTTPTENYSGLYKNIGEKLDTTTPEGIKKATQYLKDTQGKFSGSEPLTPSTGGEIGKGGTEAIAKDIISKSKNTSEVMGQLSKLPIEQQREVAHYFATHQNEIGKGVK